MDLLGGPAVIAVGLPIYARLIRQQLPDAFRAGRLNILFIFDNNGIGNVFSLLRNFRGGYNDRIHSYRIIRRTTLRRRKRKTD